MKAEKTRLIKVFTVAMLLLLALPLGAKAQSTDMEVAVPLQDGLKLQIPVGESRVLVTPDLSRVSVSNPAVADLATLSTSEILVVAKSPGRTNIIVWLDGNRSNVTVEVIPDLEPVKAAIASAYGDLPITLTTLKETVLLSGTVSSDEIKEDLGQIVNSTGFPVVNLLQVKRVNHRVIEVVKGTDVQSYSVD